GLTAACVYYVSFGFRARRWTRARSGFLLFTRNSRREWTNVAGTGLMSCTEPSARCVTRFEHAYVICRDALADSNPVLLDDVADLVRRNKATGENLRWRMDGLSGGM